MMSSILDVFCTWNREVISVSGENSLYLLMEWRSGPPAKRQSKLMPKLLYRDVELLLKPEDGVVIKAVHGARAKETDAGWVLQMGSAYKGKTKTLLLELAVSSQSAGKKSVCSAYWSAFKTKQEQRVLLRREQIYLQISAHLGLMNKQPDLRVQKHVKLSETTGIMKQALRAFERGRTEEGCEIIKRHTDELLIMAVRSGDLEYYREAQILIQLGEYYQMTYEKLNDEHSDTVRESSGTYYLEEDEEDFMEKQAK
ncbi:hypothetical protein ACFSVM_02565 [Paenibacillus shunpengii]|uniref:Uncharacterized protein n=1 Tax=Paenibacillus shunpengii TaxID=2054424 RepID=A0ABW5SJH8_9BACL|nr:hypothetical protein [Paenibacillus sp. PDC88]